MGRDERPSGQPLGQRHERVPRTGAPKHYSEPEFLLNPRDAISPKHRSADLTPSPLRLIFNVASSTNLHRRCMFCRNHTSQIQMSQCRNRGRETEDAKESEPIHIRRIQIDNRRSDESEKTQRLAAGTCLMIFKVLNKILIFWFVNKKCTFWLTTRK